MNFWDKLPPHFLVLAPMDGITNFIFRQIIARAGRPDVFFTEFTNISGFTSAAGHTVALQRLHTSPDERPIVAQIWGSDPEKFAATAKKLTKLGFSGIDLNFGCPDRHVIRAGGGSAMIRSHELALACAAAAHAHTNLPLSIKTRLGYSDPAEFTDWLSFLLNQHPAALTVHLRTKQESTKIPAHFELIPDIIKLRDQHSPATKLIINGDIKNRAQATKLMTKFPAVDGCMIGRGALENPFCFTDRQPSRAELLRLFLYHLDLFDRQVAEIAAQNNASNSPIPLPKFAPLKHYFKVYLHGFAGAKTLRDELMHATSTTEIRARLKNPKNML